MSRRTIASTIAAASACVALSACGSAAAPTYAGWQAKLQAIGCQYQPQFASLGNQFYAMNADTTEAQVVGDTDQTMNVLENLGTALGQVRVPASKRPDVAGAIAQLNKATIADVSEGAAATAPETMAQDNLVDDPAVDAEDLAQDIATFKTAMAAARPYYVALGMTCSASTHQPRQASSVPNAVQPAQSPAQTTTVPASIRYCELGICASSKQAWQRAYKQAVATTPCNGPNDPPQCETNGQGCVAHCP